MTDMPDAPKLKPCPFCGESVCGPVKKGPSANKWWEVACEYCDCQGPMSATSDMAISGWNARYKPKVKPLVWVERGNNTREAGAYQIRFSQPGVYRIAFHGKIVCRAIKGIHAAKNWANNHNRDRILEALE